MSFALAIPYITEEEYLDLPETMQRQELLDGEVIVPPAPSLDHQDLVGHLFRRLADWADAHPPAWAAIAPVDVHLGRDRILQPDLLVLKSGRPRLAPVRETPDLVVEVISQRRGYDRLTKRLVYAEAGIPEYWIVDPYSRTVEQIQGLETVATERARVRSLVLDGFELDLVELFRRLG